MGFKKFLQGLAPDFLYGFWVRSYEEKRESFDLFAAKIESGAMRLNLGGNRSGAGAVNGELKLVQNRSKNRY